MERASQLAPDLPGLGEDMATCYAKLGVAKFQQNDFQGAEVDFRRATECAPASVSPELRFLLGTCYLRLKDPAHAGEQFMIVVTSGGNSQVAQQAKQMLSKLPPPEVTSPLEPRTDARVLLEEHPQPRQKHCLSHADTRLSRTQVPQLAAHERAALAGLHVLKLGKMG